VLNLVRQRKVLLHKGSALVPRHELVSVVSGKFRNKLSHTFAVNRLILCGGKIIKFSTRAQVLTKQQSAFADERLNQIFRLVRQRGCSVSNFTPNDNDSTVITAGMVDEVTKSTQ